MADWRNLALDCILADGKIVDEMEDPTAERVLDRMKRLGE